MLWKAKNAGQLLERVGSLLAKRYSPLVRSGRLKERAAQLAEALYARRLDGRILRCWRMCSFSRRTTAPITNWRTNTATSARWMRNSCARCWVRRNPYRCMMDGHPELQVRRPPQFTRKIVQNCELRRHPAIADLSALLLCTLSRLVSTLRNKFAVLCMMAKLTQSIYRTGADTNERSRKFRNLHAVVEDAEILKGVNLRRAAVKFTP